MIVRTLMITALSALGGLGFVSAAPAGPVVTAIQTEQNTRPPVRFRVGEVTVIALSDGQFPLSTDQLLIEDRPGVIAPLLASAGLTATPITAVNAYLIDTGDRRILIDAGAGALLGDSVGHLVENLARAGYTPDQIDEVLITHLHPDHVGGLTRDNAAVFPRAIVRLASSEQAFWLDKANQPAVDPSVQGAFDGAAASLAPYLTADRVRPLRDGESVAPGLTAVTLAGHTQGHTGYRLESRGEVLVFWGDLVHVAAVQFADPAVTIRFDSNPEDARETRLAAYAAAAASHDRIAASHIDYPGVGTVEIRGRGYAWIPTSSAPR